MELEPRPPNAQVRMPSNRPCSIFLFNSDPQDFWESKRSMLFSRQTLVFVTVLGDFTWLPFQAHHLLRRMPRPASHTPRSTVRGGRAQGRGLRARPDVKSWLWQGQGPGYPEVGR